MAAYSRAPPSLPKPAHNTIAARFVESAPIDFYHNSKPITLPPTPEDLQLVEVMLNDLAGLRMSTDEIMNIVGQHAFGGLSREVARMLISHIAEAAALCRRCEHCVLRCNPRAVVVVEGAEGRDLALEVKQATQHFEQVASAARSMVLRVVKAPMCAEAAFGYAVSAAGLEARSLSGSGGVHTV